MNTFARVFAALIARRPAALILAALILAGASIFILNTRRNFDSDILNLLPAENPAVRGLKLYNTEFTQTRELAFVLSWEKPPEDIEAIRDTFVEKVRQQPWVTRVLDGTPMETQRGRTSMQSLIAPLLLNLPPGEFAEAIAQLNPATLRERVLRLAGQTAAGSPRARMELESDPLGLAGRAAQPIWKTVALSDTFDLISPDGTAIIVPTISNQMDSSADACRALMPKVREFMRTAAPDGCKVMVTGRSAYVEEISTSMERDIALTATVSLLSVTAIFWFGFRRFVPLVGIALILALTALATLAFGALIFDQLNLIAIGFCSILFGLGDDFSLLLSQRYYQSRSAGNHREAAIAESLRHSTPGILWVAVTTGIGFLALWFSNSSGFAQLGTLVAVGVAICAVLMISLILIFAGSAPVGFSKPGLASAYAHWSVSRPRSLLIGASMLFGTALIIALLPWRPLHYDLSPSSLEPKNAPAAQALAVMTTKFPAYFEPVMVVLPKAGEASLTALDAVLERLKTEGRIAAYSSPSALVLYGNRFAANKTTLAAVNLPEAQAAFSAALQEGGMNRETFAGSLSFFDQLSASSSFKNWPDLLSQDSPWWFLLDRMVSPDSGSIIAYLRLPKGVTPEERIQLSEAITAAVPEALVTGWSQTLASLLPWTHRELVVFGSLVAVIILLILAFIYRDVRLWVLHALSLVAALAGTAATLKLTNQSINLLNVLAFPLMIAVGVDYGTHLILAARESGSAVENLAGVIKPVALSGLTTVTGFGSLLLAKNPALSGLGVVCATGVAWCLLASLLIVVPGAAAIARLAKKPARG